MNKIQYYTEQTRKAYMIQSWFVQWTTYVWMFSICMLWRPVGHPLNYFPFYDTRVFAAFNRWTPVYIGPKLGLDVWGTDGPTKTDEFSEKFQKGGRGVSFPIQKFILQNFDL